jgi:hypothetical protein
MNDLERFDPKPTCVRYGVMGYISALAFILFIDRICIGQAVTWGPSSDLGI